MCVESFTRASKYTALPLNDEKEVSAGEEASILNDSVDVNKSNTIFCLVGIRKEEKSKGEESP